MCTNNWALSLKIKSIPKRELFNPIRLAIRLTLEVLCLYPENVDINSRNMDNSLAFKTRMARPTAVFLSRLMQIYSRQTCAGAIDRGSESRLRGCDDC